MVTLLMCWCGDLDAGQRVLGPLRSFGRPLQDSITVVPYVDWQSAPDPGFPARPYVYVHCNDASAFVVRITRFLERLSTSFASHVITVSECFRSLLAARGVDPARVSVLYNSQPMPEGLQRVPPLSPVMITHASLVERYGIQVAIRALPHLLERWPDLTYEVLGDGEHLDVEPDGG